MRSAGTFIEDNDVFTCIAGFVKGIAGEGATEMGLFEDNETINRLMTVYFLQLTERELSQEEVNMWVLKVLVFVAVLVFVLHRIGKFIEHLVRDRRAVKYQQQVQQALPNYLIYDGSKSDFTYYDIDQILLKYYPYYIALNSTLKRKFTDRVYRFLRQKTFIIHDDEGYKEMPVLLSAAAVQITFGLNNFLLPFFKYIQIHPEEYFAENSLRVLAGHVHGQTITIAWNHFLKGFHKEDGKNVGLHEMAHALYFQHVIADITKDTHFVLSFEQVMTRSEQTFDQCRNQADRLYSDYAFKNLQEFWAESLEIFFEAPNKMQDCYPQLFIGICNLLKQNPTCKSDPISKVV